MATPILSLLTKPISDDTIAALTLALLIVHLCSAFVKGRGEGGGEGEKREGGGGRENLLLLIC